MWMDSLKIGAAYLITFPHTSTSSVYTLLRSHTPTARHEPLHTFLDKYGNKVSFTSGVFGMMSVVEWVVETEKEPKKEQEAEEDHVFIMMMPHVQEEEEKKQAQVQVQKPNAFPYLPHCANPMRLLPSQQRHFTLPVPEPVTLADYLKEKTIPAHDVGYLRNDDLYN